MNKMISFLELLEGERDAVQNYNSATETIELLEKHGKNSAGLIMNYKQTQRSVEAAIKYYRQEIKSYIEELENL